MSTPAQSVFDEVRSTTAPPTAPPSGSSVFDEVRTSAAPAATAPPADTGWTGAAKGVGDAALALGAGTLKRVSTAVNNLTPDVIPGESRADVAQKIASDPILNYEPQTDEGKYLMGKIRSLLSPVAAVQNTAHDWIARSSNEHVADLAGDVATVALPVARDVKYAKDWMGEGAQAVEQGHPLTQAAEAETSRLGDIKARAESSGYDLPEGGTQARHAEAAANNRPLVNAAAREELNLPKNAPMTPQMLEQGRQQFGSPGYQAIQNINKPIPLDQAALNEARASNMNGTPNERLPFPSGNSISGADAVDFSKKARYLANQLEKNPANPFAAQDAQMYRDAAEAVENSVSKYLRSRGQSDVAKGWDDARVYYAKSYSVQNALDGAGNVRATDLKTQLFKKGKPLSGNLEDVANLAAQYPEAFKSSRVTMPQAGPVKRAAAAALPLVGATVGGTMGGGVGAAVGDAAGAYGANKLLGH